MIAILHTIFFHRYFIAIAPLTRDLLDLTLPAVDDVDLETLIDQRTAALVRAIESTHQQRGRGQLVVQFFEKKRKKTYFFGKADEEVCWEQWTLDVTLATPRTDSGTLLRVGIYHSLTVTNRAGQGSARDDQVAFKSCLEDCEHRQSVQRSHPANHDDRSEPFPLPGHREPETYD